MATNNLFAQMLNQKPIAAPQIGKPVGFKIQPPQGTPEFANLNSPLAHPMEKRGPDISQSVWGRMLNSRRGI